MKNRHMAFAFVFVMLFAYAMPVSAGIPIIGGDKPFADLRVNGLEADTVYLAKGEPFILGWSSTTDDCLVSPMGFKGKKGMRNITGLSKTTRITLVCNYGKEMKRDEVLVQIDSEPLEPSAQATSPSEPPARRVPGATASRAGGLVSEVEARAPRAELTSVTAEIKVNQTKNSLTVEWGTPLVISVTSSGADNCRIPQLGIAGENFVRNIGDAKNSGKLTLVCVGPQGEMAQDSVQVTVTDVPLMVIQHKDGRREIIR